LNAELKNFIKQDVANLFKKLPWYAETIANGITDLGARLKILAGQGQQNIIVPPNNYFV
jgi:hypothetical protein